MNRYLVVFAGVRVEVVAVDRNGAEDDALFQMNQAEADYGPVLNVVRI